MERNTQKRWSFPVPMIATDESCDEFKEFSLKNTNSSRLQSKIQHLGIKDSASATTDRDDQESISDCESAVSGTNNGEAKIFGDGLIKVDEEDRFYQIIKRSFDSASGNFGPAFNKIEAIRKNVFSSFSKQARFQSFLVFSQAMERKCGGDANIKYAWFGASKDEITNIISHGFSNSRKNDRNELYPGGGICLSPAHSPTES